MDDGGDLQDVSRVETSFSQRLHYVIVLPIYINFGLP